MTTGTLPEQLRRLYELILRERECAKVMDLVGLEAVGVEKEELLQYLEPLAVAETENSQVRVLAEKIKLENRRNAYLFWTTLRYIRDSMSFITRQVGQPAYGAGGRMVSNASSGLILSGRV